MEHDVLMICQTSGEAIKGLYRRRKELEPSYSYATLRKLSGIPSNGLISDIIHGKRTTPEKYIEGLCDAFSLTGYPAELLKTLILCDNTRSEPQYRKLTTRLEALRKLIRWEAAGRLPTLALSDGRAEILSGLVIAVHRATLPEKLHELRDRFLELAAALEDEQGDATITLTALAEGPR